MCLTSEQEFETALNVLSVFLEDKAWLEGYPGPRKVSWCHDLTAQESEQRSVLGVRRNFRTV